MIWLNSARFGRSKPRNSQENAWEKGARENLGRSLVLFNYELAQLHVRVNATTKNIGVQSHAFRVCILLRHFVASGHHMQYAHEHMKCVHEWFT